MILILRNPNYIVILVIKLNCSIYHTRAEKTFKISKGNKVCI